MTKANNKSPILIIEDLFEPHEAMDIADGAFGVTPPELDDAGNPIVTKISNDVQEIVVGNKLLEDIIPKIEEHFGVTQKGITRPVFEWYPEGTRGDPRAENASFIEGKWVRTNTSDFTGVLFLSSGWGDDVEEQDMDIEFVSYGGNLEFLNHKFNIRPKIGTLVIFPSDPRFLNATSAIAIGNLKQVRFNIVCETPYSYDPAQFPGDYTTWF